MMALLGCGSVGAQERLAETGNTRQDFSGLMAEFGDGRRIDPAKIAAAYMYEINYDSTRILYTLTEVKLNGAPLILRDWSYNTQRDEWDSGLLNSNSGTTSFTLHTGDTIRMYREFQWYGQRSGQEFLNNYSASDTLTYSIGLVDAGSGNRLALIDTLGVLRRDVPGIPSIHGNHPLYAMIDYVVPPAQNGKLARIAIDVETRGAGDYYFIRRNIRTVHLSDNLTDSTCLRNNWNYGGSAFGRRSPDELRGAAGSQTWLSVAPNPARDEVTISVTAAGSGASVAIYDLLGNLVFVPELSASGDSHIVRYRFEHPGTYYVALLEHGVITASRQLTILR